MGPFSCVGRGNSLRTSTDVSDQTDTEGKYLRDFSDEAFRRCVRTKSPSVCVRGRREGGKEITGFWV